MSTFYRGNVEFDGDTFLPTGKVYQPPIMPPPQQVPAAQAQTQAPTPADSDTSAEELRGRR